MRAIVQRVTRATVCVAGEVVGEIGAGLVVLVGVRHGDSPGDAAWLVEKLTHLRIFEDDAGKMNRSLLGALGAALVVSQFTLYSDTRRGRRPSFASAGAPALAADLIARLVDGLRENGIPTATGRFGAHMTVELVNDGPVTLLLDTPSPEGP